MLKQAASLLSYRKKSTCLMVTLIATAAFLMMSIAPLFSAIRNKIFSVYAEQLGIYHGIVFDITEEQKQRLEENPVIARMGIIRNFGNYRLDYTEQTLTVGNFDEEAMALGAISVTQGRLPESSDEIALENHVRYQLPEGTDIGSQIFLLKENGERVGFTICGFVKDYKANWSEQDIVLPGRTDLPSGFLLNGERLQGQEVLDVLLYLHTINKMEAPESTLVNCVSGFHQQGEYLLFNHGLYTNVAMTMLRPIHTYQSIFTLLILLGVGAALYTALFSYLRHYEDVAMKLYSLGATHRAVWARLLLWSVLLGGTGTLLGFGFCSAFSVWAKQNIGYGIELVGRWKEVVVLIAVILLITGVFFFWKIRKLADCSISEQKQQTKIRELNGKIDFSVALAAEHIRKNWKQLIAVSLMIVMLLIIFFCIKHDEEHRGMGYVGEYPFLTAYSKEGSALVFYGDFEFLSKGQTYAIEDVESLRSLPGVLGIQAMHYGSSANLIFPEEVSDYTNWIYQQTTTTGFDRDIALIADAPKNIKSTQEGYGIIVLNQEDQERFQMQYPFIDVEKALRKGAAILFCPDIQIEDGYVTAIGNRTIKAGDTLRFGRLQSEASFLEATENPALITYTEETLIASEVLNQSFYMDWAYGNEEIAYQITIVVSQETAKATEFLSGINNFTVYLEKDISDADYKNVEERFNRIAFSTQGALISRSKEIEAFNDLLHEATRLSYTVVLGVLGTFAGIILVSVIYGNLLQRQRMFGILRATGYRKRYLFQAVWLEMLVYWVVIAILSYPIALYVNHQFSLKIVGPVMQAADLWVLAGKISVFSIGLLLIFTLLAWLITRSVFKKSISSCIRFAE
ncbi:MAG: hypothetical protein DBY39_06590 [Clostridiales bacterium]|nr:MAG: hypothetical protein DBY39_06590 [Clostridiales bacterium]